MNRAERYRKIKEELLKKEAMLTLYNTDRIRFHNLVCAILENSYS